MRPGDTFVDMTSVNVCAVTHVEFDELNVEYGWLELNSGRHYVFLHERLAHISPSWIILRAGQEIQGRLT